MWGIRNEGEEEQDAARWVEIHAPCALVSYVTQKATGEIEADTWMKRPIAEIQPPPTALGTFVSSGLCPAATEGQP